MLLNFEEALKYIENLPTFSPEGVSKGKMSYDLDGIRELVSRVKNPEQDLKIIHIAGTNGKGSTGTYLRNILTNSGYKTGHFSSPELIRFDEQISINGKTIREEDTTRILNRLKMVAEEMMAENLAYPSKFELILTMAFIYFAEENCDFVILECGLGGTNDATNIIGTPEIAVITDIDFDHTSILGNTLGEIASHKAGIIKQGGTALSVVQESEAKEVITARTGEVDAKLHFVTDEPEIIERSLEGQSFKLKGYTRAFHTRLLGLYQIKNALLAIRAAEILEEKASAMIGEENIREGILKTRYPCRFELISKEPNIIVDGAHNTGGVQSLADSLNICFPGKKALMIAGVLADKDYKEMLGIISPFAKRLLAVKPISTRALPEERLAEAAIECGIDSEACKNYEEAVRKAMSEEDSDGLICIFGSLYCVGMIRELILEESA